MSTYTVLASIHACTYVMHEELGNAAEIQKIETAVLTTYEMVSRDEWQRLLAEERHSRELDKQAVERLMASYKD